ncbi:hypothetical protein C8Q79DRAFT_676396 [Trametes meyenii]|nr:hypothetical protein C8Q79DRAFT_676396 [Trametes meyenii]
MARSHLTSAGCCCCCCCLIDGDETYRPLGDVTGFRGVPPQPWKRRGGWGFTALCATLRACPARRLQVAGCTADGDQRAGLRPSPGIHAAASQAEARLLHSTYVSRSTTPAPPCGLDGIVVATRVTRGTKVDGGAIERTVNSQGSSAPQRVRVHEPSPALHRAVWRRDTLRERFDALNPPFRRRGHRRRLLLRCQRLPPCARSTPRIPGERREALPRGSTSDYHRGLAGRAWERRAVERRCAAASRAFCAPLREPGEEHEASACHGVGAGAASRRAAAGTPSVSLDVWAASVCTGSVLQEADSAGGPGLCYICTSRSRTGHA